MSHVSCHTAFSTIAVGTVPEYLDVLDARMGRGVFLSPDDLRPVQR